MITELVFVKLFLDRETYLKYRSYLPGEDLDKTVLTVLLELDNWYRLNADDNCTLEGLQLLCMPKMDRTEVQQIFKSLTALEIPSTAVEALRQYKRKRVQEDLSMAALDASQGSEEADRRVDKLYLDLAELNGVIEDENPFFDNDLENALKANDRSGGLQWRLRTLRESVGNLLPGDFGFFVARPETGKTTMLASEITHMADQLGDDKGPIIWFNNEEPGARVMLRLYQAYLGWTYEQIRDNMNRAIELYQPVKDRILVIDRSILHKQEVERVCNTYKPSLMILDQIDPIVGFKADREDLKLGAIYKWARALSKQHGMSTIAVCQADASAEGVRWLHMDNVSNAKTEKQATADWIIGIGKIHDPAAQASRFLSLMKNKLTGRHERHEVLIKPEVARYVDL